MRLRVLVTSLVLTITWFPAADAETVSSEVLLRDYLVHLSEQGIRIIFSSDLVTDDMVIAAPEGSVDTLDEFRDLLRPFGLSADDGPSGSFLIVRPPGFRAPVMPPPAPVEAPIPEIVVTSSLHRLEYEQPTSHTYFDSELAERVPITGDEVVRLTSRLPGTANGGISSRPHVRGGEDNEVLFLFDGLRLYEPYHMRDFQSVASIVNSSAVGGIDFFTGAYPVQYGDRMSGVLVMDMREPTDELEAELALSFFNASALMAGRFGSEGQGDWLLTARRGNLDLIVDVVDPDRGSPDYSDYLAHVAWEFGPRGVVGANLLVSRDKIDLFDDDRGESAGASYANTVSWITWEADWSEALRSRTLFAASNIEDGRQGTLLLPGIVTGSLDEEHDLSAYQVRQDWTWVMSQNWMISFGADLKHLDAEYRHDSQRLIAAPFAGLLGNPQQRVLDYDLVVDGGQYAAYSELRWRASPKLVLDLGIRWDQQTYPIAEDDRQYSPRASLLYQPTERTEIRLGWGQYYQAQETNELQLADGVAQFFPAQRAEHFVLNVQQQTGRDTAAELSVFRKSFRTLRPRFENVFNSLTLVPELQFDRIMIDPDKAESFGAELSISHGTSSDDLLWWMSYTLAETRDWTDAGKVERSWDQTHTLKGGVAWRRKPWDFSAAAEVHTGWPATALVVDNAGDIGVTERNQRRYPTFASVDIRISREFEVGRGELNAYLDVTNVLDRDNPCCTEYRLDAEGELASRTSHWLPLLPSLGVVWRF
jgi:outer membrane receptor protein involved in Fe transport